jgi:hypothetical protein
MFATLAKIENKESAQPASVTLSRDFAQRQFCISQISETNLRRMVQAEKSSASTRAVSLQS